ncbi:MAG: bile acid:sodium symporter family protein [Sphingomonadaceae bacterium]|nr:bile acid:sodium symporter [Sphingomonadaceae bacterium]
MLRGLFSRIDLMVRLLVLAILLASFLPATGSARGVAQMVSNSAVFLLFLLNGMRLERADVLRGIGNWRLLGALSMFCFGAMALAGLGIAKIGDNHLPPLLALGFLYLGALPSTVQSATAYTSLAGGNVANSVVAAALLNILGVFVTVPIFSLLGEGEGVELGSDGLIKIVVILILPFAMGQALQTRTHSWVVEHKGLIGWMDRLAIATAVYVAFSGAVEQGIWSRLDIASWGMLLAGVAVLMLFGFLGSWSLGGLMHLPRADRISFMFAGAQKSTAMGAPLAMVLFPPATAGLVLVPLLTYHLLQLVLSAPLAKQLALKQ